MPLFVDGRQKRIVDGCGRFIDLVSFHLFGSSSSSIFDVAFFAHFDLETSCQQFQLLPIEKFSKTTKNLYKFEFV